MPVILPPHWHNANRRITDRNAWLNRRQYMTGGAAALMAGCLPLGRASSTLAELPKRYPYKLPSVSKHATYKAGHPNTPVLTNEQIAASYNNYYEFTTDKGRVWELAKDFETRPWTVHITGKVAKPLQISVDDLLKQMPLEERAYRFRCVEAWSMVVPWTGFPLRKLIERAQPLSSAKYVRLITRNAPQAYPGVRSQPWYPWPYFEGLTIAEATHDLTMLAVGIYGHPLPNQHGAPLRLVVPWKYGFKNIKAISRIELVEEQPRTFWNNIAPAEYDFGGNVRPDVPHLRWSQATDRDIETGTRRPTPMYNGYAEQVASLYPSGPKAS